MKKMKGKIDQQSHDAVERSRGIVKRIGLQIKQRPIVTTLVTVFVFALLGVGLYQLIGAASSHVAKVDPKIKPEKSVGTSTKKTEAPVDPIASSSPTPAPAANPPAPAPKAVSKNDASAPSSSVTYSPNCRGAGCATPNPTYSIITNSAITVTAGLYVGPFTASTSNGSAVSWAGPQYNGSGFGPYGYTQGSMQSAASFEYYIRAESDVAPGKYTLYMSAIQPSTQSLVKTTIAVTVLAAPPSPPPYPSQ